MNIARPGIAFLAFSLLVSLIVQKYTLLDGVAVFSKKNSCGDGWTRERVACYDAIAQRLAGKNALALRAWSAFFPPDDFARTIVNVHFVHQNDSCSANISVASRALWLADGFCEEAFRAWVRSSSVGAFPATTGTVTIDITPVPAPPTDINTPMCNATTANATLWNLTSMNMSAEDNLTATDDSPHLGAETTGLSACCAPCARWALAQAALDLPVMARGSPPSAMRAVRLNNHTSAGDESFLWSVSTDGLKEIRMSAVVSWGVFSVLFLAAVSGLAALQFFWADIVHNYGVNDGRRGQLLFPMLVINSGAKPSLVFAEFFLLYVFVYLQPTTDAAMSCDNKPMCVVAPILTNFVGPLLLSLLVFACVRCAYRTLSPPKRKCMNALRGEDVRRVAYSATLAIFVASVALSLQLALLGLVEDWSNALNPLAKLSIVLVYTVIIVNSKVVHGRIVPLELQLTVQAVYRLRWYDRHHTTGQPYILPSERLQAETPDVHHIYSRGGRIRRSSDALRHMLRHEKRFMSLLLEPIMLLLFLAVLNSFQDNVEVFSSSVWSPVLSVGVVSVALVPQMVTFMSQWAAEEQYDNVLTALADVRDTLDTLQAAEPFDPPENRVERELVSIRAAAVTNAPPYDPRYYEDRFYETAIDMLSYYRTGALVRSGGRLSDEFIELVRFHLARAP
eukprot:TRINITY_DN1489_c0_g1_i1.p1 TRINITY_DN1489_c0_g1~~TRINITY_DN1489_c0_g1_i1.p1  ORF type:complete len:695 (+),score=-33.61 TRINITY_DN1489_c0_g1_i1:54-2087(+)